MYRAIFAAALALTIAAPCTAEPAAKTEAFHVGQAMRLFHPDAVRHWRGAKTQALRTTIWFPVDAAIPAQSHDIGPPGAPLFYGHKLAAGATLASAHKTYPLIVLSHGTGGTAESMEWLGAELAASGYIVAAVDHPGNNALEPMTWDGFTLWWERATDLSEVLDGVLADPELAPHVDATRIGALGFSLGGYTVLELAGGRTDLAALKAFFASCGSHAADALCHPPEMDRVVDLQSKAAEPTAETRASQARSGASYKDNRIKAVFAISPALGQVFDTHAFADVDIPVALLYGSADVSVPPATNVQHIASLMSKASLTAISGAGHYTFLAICAPAMAARAAELCSDKSGVDRAEVHAQAVEQARGFFARTLARKRR